VGGGQRHLQLRLAPPILAVAVSLQVGVSVYLVLQVNVCWQCNVLVLRFGIVVRSHPPVADFRQVLVAISGLNASSPLGARHLAPPKYFLCISGSASGLHLESRD